MHQSRHLYGAVGVISVTSNVVPGLVKRLMTQQDDALDAKLQPLYKWPLRHGFYWKSTFMSGGGLGLLVVGFCLVLRAGSFYKQLPQDRFSAGWLCLLFGHTISGSLR